MERGYHEVMSRRSATVAVGVAVVLALALTGAGLGHRYRIFSTRATHQGSVQSIDITEDGRWAVVNAVGCTRVWDLSNPLDLRRGPPVTRAMFGDDFHAVWLVPGTTLLASQSDRLIEWDFDHGEIRSVPLALPRNVRALAVS